MSVHGQDWFSSSRPHSLAAAPWPVGTGNLYGMAGFASCIFFEDQQKPLYSATA
ncbi:hypothetical protein MGG_15593 [Pyricularia oryzae 70-15]|uniref:Uncharacterized protein n=1 Tax=Pyricularia oryzae (strain 70-15 / ATCC MYA-4617 / FGSC 8958) TaxID=242507 RepID=G4MUR8_PYRO7|nr:uncharacterized protein MGG_15593 [Pyricularia oryzae 70-15]EHA54041.1 hypothetical protein MGG_15593 [Pyricularia oryzae 70-15]